VAVVTGQAIRSGALDRGLPYLASGTGPPLVVLPGWAPTHENPTGVRRWLHLAPLGELRDRRTVYLIGRRPGLPAGSTVADLAADYASALSAQFGDAVDAVGISAGGAIALQLAADHPHAVRRLVVTGAAHTFSQPGRAAMGEWLARARAGRPSMQPMAGVVTSSPPLRPLAFLVMALQDLALRGKDLADGIETAEALFKFDCLDRLPRVAASTLVIAGERDPFLSSSILERTVAAIPRARLEVYPRRGHAGATLDRRFAREVTAFLTP
jgi:pimeloyl-ACP methyl ester carboxylesterase